MQHPMKQQSEAVKQVQKPFACKHEFNHKILHVLAESTLPNFTFSTSTYDSDIRYSGLLEQRIPYHLLDMTTGSSHRNFLLWGVLVGKWILQALDFTQGRLVFKIEVMGWGKGVNLVLDGWALSAAMGAEDGGGHHAASHNYNLLCKGWVCIVLPAICTHSLSWNEHLHPSLPGTLLHVFASVHIVECRDEVVLAFSCFKSPGIGGMDRSWPLLIPCLTFW
jgi:hypothetical protein